MCYTKMKLELEKTLADLSSAKLNCYKNKDVQNEKFGHGRSANWNGIQNEKLDSRKPWKIIGQKYPNYMLP